MTTNTQTNEQPAGERAELIRRLRHIEGTTPAQLIDDCEKAAALLEADAQRPALRPLTDEQIGAVLDAAKVPEYVGSEYIDKMIVRAVEAAHGIKERP